MLYNRGYGSVQYRGVEDVLTIEFTKEPAVTAPPVRVNRALPMPVVGHRGSAPAARRSLRWRMGSPPGWQSQRTTPPSRTRYPPTSSATSRTAPPPPLPLGTAPHWRLVNHQT